MSDDELFPRGARPPLRQGAEANRSGNVSQAIVEAYFEEFDIRIVNDNIGYHGSLLIPRADMLLIRGPTIHVKTGPRRADFLFKNYAAKRDLLIQSKQQLGRGSADEKLISQAEELGDCQYKDSWIILTGPGYARRSLKALAIKVAEINSARSKNIRIIHNIGNLLYRSIAALIHEDRVS